MNRVVFALAILVAGLAAAVAPATGIAWAGEETAEKAAAEQQLVFKAWDVYVNTADNALGAYQIEITYDKKTVRIVGIEGGEPEAFNAAPHYDPKGLKGGRIIIASFTTDKASAPKGRVRVARIHTSIEGKETPEISATLMTAGNAEGKKIKIAVELNEAKQEEKGTTDEETEE